MSHLPPSSDLSPAKDQEAGILTAIRLKQTKQIGEVMSVLPKCKNRPLASAFSEPACENDGWRGWGKGDKEVSSLLKPPLSLIGICERETCKEYGADNQKHDRETDVACFGDSPCTFNTMERAQIIKQRGSQQEI